LNQGFWESLSANFERSTMSLSIMGPSLYDWAEKVGVGLSDFAFAMEIEELAGQEVSCADMDDVAWQFECAAQAQDHVHTRKEVGEKNSSTGKTLVTRS
jgi:hypothetical protein